MAQASAEASLIAQRYARALLESALEAKASAKILDGVAADLAALAVAYQESESLQRLAMGAGYGAAGGKALDAIATKMKLQAVSATFIQVLLANGRLALLPQLAVLFQHLLSEHKGEVVVQLETAKPVSPAARKKLEAALKKKAAGTVVLEESVAPELLGGAVIRMGSRMLDASVKGRLERLEQALKAV